MEPPGRSLERSLLCDSHQSLELGRVEAHETSEALLHLLKKLSLGFIESGTYGRRVSSAVAGLLTGLTLIVAIGAQNAFVLRQGVLRSHIGSVVAVCAASDLILILAGVGGIGTVVEHAAWVIEVVRWFGVMFLVWYAANSLRRAFGSDTLQAGGSARALSVSGRQTILRAVALTWLNPHVYLDTVLLIGSIATAHETANPGSGRWLFATGAAAASILWFSTLGFGARLLAPLLARPRAWQTLEVLIAFTMLGIAAKLATG